MCLPFHCCDGDDHGSGAHRDTWPSPATDRGNGTHHGTRQSPLKGANPGYGVGKNGAGNAVQQGRAAAGVNMNGEPGAAFSDSDMPASIGFVQGRKGAADKMAAPAALVPQTPEHMEPKTVVSSPIWMGAPAPQAHVTAGARHHGTVAASQPKETMQTAPVPQVARRDEDDYYSATAASSYSRWK